MIRSPGKVTENFLCKVEKSVEEETQVRTKSQERSYDKGGYLRNPRKTIPFTWFARIHNQEGARSSDVSAVCTGDCDRSKMRRKCGTEIHILASNAKSRNQKIITGYFNVAADWSSRTTNIRSPTLLKILAELDFVLVNTGDLSNFRGKDPGSTITNLTYASISGTLAKRMAWIVSKHYINFPPDGKCMAHFCAFLRIGSWKSGLAHENVWKESFDKDAIGRPWSRWCGFCLKKKRKL